MKKLEGYFKFFDFFGIEKYFIVKFDIIKVIFCGMLGVYKVIGNLMIKEMIKEIKFNM